MDKEKLKVRVLSDEKLKNVAGGEDPFPNMHGGDCWGECQNPRCSMYQHAVMCYRDSNNKYVCAYCGAPKVTGVDI